MSSQPTAKHTPGPWKVEADGLSVSTVSDFGHDQWARLAVCASDPHGHGEANARLIAAAPDLLKALERVLYIRDSLQGNAAAQAWDKLDGEARAALKLAKGE